MIWLPPSQPRAYIYYKHAGLTYIQNHCYTTYCLDWLLLRPQALQQQGVEQGDTGFPPAASPVHAEGGTLEPPATAAPHPCIPLGPLGAKRSRQIRRKKGRQGHDCSGLVRTGLMKKPTEHT
jgi:hypothetical protein